MCVLADSRLIQSVGDWLADLELLQYENTLIGNGYDDMDFMVRTKCYVEIDSVAFMTAVQCVCLSCAQDFGLLKP